MRLEDSTKVLNETKIEKLNDLWENYRYKDNEYPEVSDNFKFSIAEWAIIQKHASNPETLKHLAATSIEANRLKEELIRNPELTDFEMYQDYDGEIVYDEKAYEKAFEEFKKHEADIYTRQDKVDSVRRQYPEEMKILENFFDVQEDWLRERKEFFFELAQNKKLLSEITDNQNETLEQSSARIFRKGNSITEEQITEQKYKVVEITPDQVIVGRFEIEQELDTLICNNQFLTSLYAPNVMNIVCNSNYGLNSIDAPDAITIECNDCVKLGEINAPNCVKLICEGCDYLKEKDIEVAYDCEIEGLKKQRGIKM